MPFAAAPMGVARRGAPYSLGPNLKRFSRRKSSRSFAIIAFDVIVAFEVVGRRAVPDKGEAALRLFAPCEWLGGVTNHSALGFEVELDAFHPPTSFRSAGKKILGQMRNDARGHLFLVEPRSFGRKDF